MQSWRFFGTGKPFVLEDVPEPHAGPGEVVVDVKAAGLCHSDVSALDDAGWMPLFPTLPHTLGHENAGVIIEVGEGMENEWHVGDRVGLAPVMPDGDAIGYGKWLGGYGPRVKATDANLVKLPDDVGFELGALATDAGLTAYHAMVAVGGAAKGKRVGIIGLGGLGYVGARVAVLLGAEVYGAEISDKAQDVADEIGLAGVARGIDEFKDKNLELIVDYAGFGTTTAAAIETLTEYGKLVQVGMGVLESTININPVILNQLTIQGSKSGTKEDLAAIYELMRTGDLNPPMIPIKHAEIPDALDTLRIGGVSGRFIAIYDD